MGTVERIQRQLEKIKQEFAKTCQEQGEFWCPICGKWLLEKNMFQIVGHHAPDRIVIYGLCQHCSEKAAPNYVQAALEAIKERGNTIERVDQRLKFLLKDGIFK
ncbi:MAG: hypothetical protein GTN93_21505 [Anaerolineae bacterium]|nr:hypothetical protein [Anaerolineae bacterium]